MVTLSKNGKYEPFVLKITDAEIKSDTGVQTLVDKLDQVFKDDDEELYAKFKEFQKINRRDDEEVCLYVQRFSDLYDECKRQDLTLGDKVLALKLLETARLTAISKQLILTSTQKP